MSSNAEVTNILMAGVGGQGTLLASEILSEVLMLAGHDVKKAEVHGMAQRGGSVVSHVRFGHRVYSPMIPEGEGDILFGFELLETLRYLPLLRAGGTVLVNDLRIAPPVVALGKENYPADIPKRLAAGGAEVRLVNGMELAERAGNQRAVNTVLLGALSTLLDIPADLWRQAVQALVPERFVEANLKAFELGRQA